MNLPYNLTIHMNNELREYAAEPDQFKKARQHLLDEIDAVEDWKIEDLRGRYSLLSYLCRILGLHDESIDFAEKALGLAQKMNLLMYIVIDQVRLGSSLHYANKLEDSKAIFIDTIAICESYDPLKDLKDFAYHQYGKLLFEMGDFDSSEDCFKKALSLREEKAIPELIESSRYALETVLSRKNLH